ncbi:MAG: ATP-binding protein [Bacteroidales bacterium]
MKKIGITPIYVLILFAFCYKSFGQVHKQERSKKEFDKFAQRIEPKASWEDLKLPDTEIAVIKQIITSSGQTMDERKKHKLTAESIKDAGKIVFFYGDNQSEKTHAVEIIAKELGQDLYRIDLNQVVSKYIGETEKNLEMIFNKAENKDWILFFDEADALFGRRDETENNQNEPVNMELEYFLNRVEFYQSLTIITSTSNTLTSKSKLFRFKYKVHFPVPRN